MSEEVRVSEEVKANDEVMQEEKNLDSLEYLQIIPFI